MRVLGSVLIIIWRVWFYVLMAVPILLFLPFLLLFTSSRIFYPQFFFVARLWAVTILYGMGFFPQIAWEERLKKNQSYVLVANHTSMTDIMLMLWIVKRPFVFVGKQELARIPLFGYFYKRTCILVDRRNQKSRKMVFDQAERILNKGISVCIFPEGGVPEDQDLVLDEFKDGAFRMAIDYQIPIVPLVFYDNKKRFPYVFLKGSPGRMRARVKPFITTEGLSYQDKKALREQTREVILGELEKRDHD